MRAGAKRALLTGILHNLWLPGALVAGKETPRYGTTIWLGAERLSLYSDTLRIGEYILKRAGHLPVVVPGTSASSAQVPVVSTCTCTMPWLTSHNKVNI